MKTYIPNEIPDSIIAAATKSDATAVKPNWPVGQIEAIYNEITDAIGAGDEVVTGAGVAMTRCHQVGASGAGLVAEFVDTVDADRVVVAAH